MSHQFGLVFSRSALAVAVAIVAAAPALAQNTTSAIGGRIVGADGKPVGGATVVIVHKESGSANTLTTDAEGRYNARGLRVGGPYTVTVSKGSDKEVRDDIYLALAETFSLDLRLGAANQQLDTVVTTGSSANVGKFNLGAMGAGTNLSRSELDAYASISRSLQDYARTDPRLSQTDKERGEISALGQNSRFNAITIDGVATNDTFGLESNNLPTAKQPISIDAVQSVQVNISNFDVTQKGYTGANINAVTKSGTNEFKGSVYYVYRNDSLAGDRYNATTLGYDKPAPFKEDTKGFTLGGPIIKDKLFFFANYEELRSSRSTPSYGPIGSDLTNVGITQAQIDQAIATAKNTWGMDVGSTSVPGGVELVVRDTLLKLDWNIADNHRANLRYSRTRQSEPIFYNFGTRSLSLSSHWTKEVKDIETLVGQWFADWTPNFSTELKVSQRDYDKVFDNGSTLPMIVLNFAGTAPSGTASGSRSLNMGTENSRQFNVLRTKTLDTYFAGNWIVDDHEVKFGADLSKNDVYNAFLQNTNGNYSFGCEASSPTWTYSFGAVTGANCSTTSGNAALAAQAVLENFAKGRPSSYSSQAAAGGAGLDAAAAIWSVKNYGLFAQDTWVVNDKLTLIAGLRVDALRTGDRPTANAAVKTAFGYDNTQTMDGQNLFQPRFGFNYLIDPKAKFKTQLRGGVGLFQGAAANVWLSNPYSNTGIATVAYQCTTAVNCLNSGVKFNPNPNAQPVVTTGSTPNVDILAPGAKQPSLWKLNLALDTQLPFWGLNFGADVILTKNQEALYYQHLNLGTPVTTGPDGRQVYYNAAGMNPSCWAGNATLVTTATGCGAAQAKGSRNTSFGNVLLAQSSNKGTGAAVTFSLSQQPMAGLGWSLAYTRTRASEVSPLTSSTANSTFNSRSIFNPNEDVAANSAYLTRNRVNASVNWSKAFIGKYKTTVGLFYEGRSGKPYSWTFNNDMNGDGVSGNDLMYIPKAPGSGEVEFYGATAADRAANEARFWAIVNANPELAGAKGSVVSRNNSFAQFTNSFDVRISQEVPGFFGNQKGVVSLDILNVGNLLNKRWGRIDEILFQSAGGQARSFVNYAGTNNGKYVYNTIDLEPFSTRQTKGESQWAIQVTARYEF